jgi:hypothetical protein
VRKIIGWVLLGLGAFLLVTALLLRFWGAGAVEKTPLDVNTTTRLTGTAEKLNPSTGEVESFDVKATSVTKADSRRSDDEVVVFVSTQCLVIDEGDAPDCVDAEDPQGRLVSASDDVFATDRTSAQAVNRGDYLPVDAQEHEGLVNKWPFDAQKRTYDYWDGLLGESVPAEFQGVEEIDGLETHRYDVSVEEQEAEVVEGVDGIYSTEKSIWVEPNTGSIIKQTQHEVRTLPNGDPLLDLNIAFTDDQVAKNVSEAKDSADQLKLVSSTAPLTGLIAGLVLLVIGAFLVFAGRRTA